MSNHTELELAFAEKLADACNQSGNDNSFYCPFMKETIMPKCPYSIAEGATCNKVKPEHWLIAMKQNIETSKIKGIVLVLQ